MYAKLPTSVLYHVTTADCVPSICLEGIRPELATGKLKASWYVNKSLISWGIIHVANRHVELIENIYVCAVMVEWDKMKRWSKPGFYFTFEAYHVESVTPALIFVEPDSYTGEL